MNGPVTITIKITGDRGSGKTTAAMLIATMLRAFGQKVKYNGSDCNAVIKKEIEKWCQEVSPMAGVTEVQEFIINDTDVTDTRSGRH